MGETKKRKVHTSEFKAKVGLEAVRRVKTITEIAQTYGVHQHLVGQWKKKIPGSAGALFETKRGPNVVYANGVSGGAMIVDKYSVHEQKKEDEVTA